MSVLHLLPLFPLFAPVAISCSCSALSALLLAWAAVGRHRCSVAATVLLATVSASLVGISVPLALVGWLVASVVTMQLWTAVECTVLKLLGARPLSRLERERLSADALADRSPSSSGPDSKSAPRRPDCGLEILVVDAPRPWYGRGIRTLVLSSALFDLLDDRALAGFLAQATLPEWSASVAGEWMVWLGNLPLVASASTSRLLARLGRVLAVVVGASLVLPLLIWPTGFIVVAGHAFGATIVGLVGAVLLSSGFAAAGLGLVVGWPVVWGLRALLAWERRRTEAHADEATIRAGLGWPLLEAMETLAWAASLPGPDGVFGLLCQPGAPFAERADRVWKALSHT